MTDRDDETWRAIVDNYGDRAELDESRAHPAAEPSPPASAEPAPPSSTEPSPQTSPEPGPRLDEGHFVPPPPPPLPYVAPVRLVAWTGLVGAPLVLLLAALVGTSVPAWLAYLLVAWFVGGFAYLVSRMKQRPDDPWDDGARV